MQRDSEETVICLACKGDGKKDYYISHEEGAGVCICPECNGTGRLIKSINYKPFKSRYNA